MSTRPDLTARQFRDQCRTLGIVPGFGGWWYVTATTAVHPANAGSRRRDQLAYLKREQDKAVIRGE